MALKLSDLFSFGKKDARPDSIPQSTTIVVQNTSEVGSTGTKIFGGYLSEEYLAALRGRARADVFDKMRRSDPQVKMCLSAVKNPIKSATWDIEPGDDSDEAKADADFVKHVLFEGMERPFKKTISEALTAVEFGFCVLEVVDSVVVGHPTFGSYNGIRKLGFRSQRTIERWNKDPKTGSLASVSQYAYGDEMKVVDIPADFLLLFTMDQEGENYEGISLLRPCYGSWLRKDKYMKLNAIGIEKFAIPTPVVDVPSGKENSPEFALLKDALEKYVAHHSAYLLKPAGWTIDLKTNTYDPQKVEVSIDNEDKRMVKAFLANFLELGMSGTGAYALSNDLSDFFLSGLVQIADEITGPFNERLIPRLVKMNRGERAKYPKLVVSGIEDKAGKELAEIIKFLADSKAIIPDDALEANLRKRYSLPAASKEGQREVKPDTGMTYDQPGSDPTKIAPPKLGLAEKIRLAEAKRKRLVGRG